jgi:hypothetical protein
VQHAVCACDVRNFRVRAQSTNCAIAKMRKARCAERDARSRLCATKKITKAKGTILPLTAMFAYPMPKSNNTSYRVKGYWVGLFTIFSVSMHSMPLHLDVGSACFVIHFLVFFLEVGGTPNGNAWSKHPANLGKSQSSEL